MVLTTDLSNPPRSEADNLFFRAALMDEAEESLEARQEVLALCASDIRWCFEAIFWTYDPRVKPSNRPFLLWPHQVHLLEQLEAHFLKGKDLLVEKSRDMGVTWVSLLWILWHWRFDKSCQAIVGSRLEDLIDQHGELDTHFERLRWQLRLTPVWWLPQGFDLSKHSAYMRLVNPENGNAVVGEAVTEDFSRQGRYNVAFLDEFASCEQAEGAWTATADSTPMRLPVSTPKGLGNKFARLRRSKTIDVLTLHWSQHPEKAKGMTCQQHGAPLPTCRFPGCSLTSPWYAGERERRSALEIAQELDIDYLGAGNPYFDLHALEQNQPEEPLVTGFFVEVDQGVEFRADANGIWKLWELAPPKLPGTTFSAVRCVIGADPAEGIGGDFSYAVVRDGQNRGVKATLRGQLPPETFAHELMKAGRFYGNAVIGCERNGPGFAVNADLVRGYGNVWHEHAMEKEGQPVTKRFGWLTNARTKELMLQQLAEEIRTGAVALRDAVLIEECKTFVRDEDGKLHADEGFHDDGVMACAIAGMLMQTLQTMKPVKRPRPALVPQTTNLAG